MLLPSLSAGAEMTFSLRKIHFAQSQDLRTHLPSLTTIFTKFPK